MEIGVDRLWERVETPFDAPALTAGAAADRVFRSTRPSLRSSSSGEESRQAILSLVVAVGLVAFVFARSVIFFAQHRRQRTLHLRKNFYWWLRYHDRQYWPLWLFYIPVYLFLPFLAWKHRSVWAWLHVNPALPNGGWWGERKSELDTVLRSCAPDHYLPGELVSPGEFAAMSAGDQAALLDRSRFPIVAKPDRGKQGQGVRVAHDAHELQSLLLSTEEDLFLQAFDASPSEAGLLFYRSPETGRIELFSITDKRFPVVVGDGRSSFFELVLADPRARFLAPIYLAQASMPLDHVPAVGERVLLTRLGNHSKGALFFSEESLGTPQLEQTLRTMFGSTAGLDFGRIDIKYASREELMAGRFHIIELNGAGAESTNIHDPKFSLGEVYKILYRQWDLLFALGRPATPSFNESVRRFFRMF